MSTAPLLPVTSHDSGRATLRETAVSTKRTSKQKVRFCAYAIFGLIFMLGFNLVFLPRTSLSRDLRRVHGDRLTSSDLKRIFLGAMQRENNIKDLLRRYTKDPHMAGQAYDLVTFTKDKFTDYGLDTKVEKYDVWLNRPIESWLKLLDSDGKFVYDASLKEDELKEDPPTQSRHSIPAFHGYSANGNVTGKYIYANYGTIEDFAHLKKVGVEVKGKIVIMRYSKIFRGLKVKHAQNEGAIGVVLYTDPFDDGAITTQKYEAYPKGPARNPSSLERGSVEYFTDCPGDPTTPGWASKGNKVKRVSPKGRIPDIPSVPVSFRSIEPVLESLNGGPSMDWVGFSEKFDYSPGPSSALLNLFNHQNYTIEPIYNVVGKIYGILPGEEVILGNHRDSWTVGGAGDPGSGSATLLEIARGCSELLKLGWKPLRTITFASWDGEEYGMLGSTEFAEYHYRGLQRHTLAYVNLDVAVSGSKFVAQSNPMLNHMVHRVAQAVPFKSDNDDYTLYDYWLQQDNATINVLGAGTDFVGFQNHLGIPSLNFEFTSDGVTDPVYHYHSNYDSFHWMEKFVDPDFSLHSTMAKFIGLLTISIGEKEVAPMKTHAYASSIRKYMDEMEFPREWKSRNIFEDESDKKLPWYAKSVLSELKKKNPDQSLKFHHLTSLLSDRISQFNATAKIYDDYTKDLQRQITQDYPWFEYYKKIKIAVQIKLANMKLVQLDRGFLFADGLRNRSWMRHVIFAPHRNLGYSGDVLPGLHEAIMDGDYQEAVRWAIILIDRVKVVEKRLR